MATRQKTRNIALTAHFDRFVQKKIESGRYQSASEVVRDSLRIMEQHELERKQAIVDLNEKIRSGYEQIKRGETVDADEVFDEISELSAAARKRPKRRQ